MLRGTIFTLSAATALAVLVSQGAFAAPVTYNWSGFYVGANAGWAWGRQSTAPIISGSGPVSTSTAISGVIGGGQIGYNWQFNRIVLGLEADFQASGQNGDFTTNNSVAGVTVTKTANEKLDYFGTVRGRIGYTWSQYLAYFTGGWAYGHATFSGVDAAIGAFDVFSGPGNMANGWTVGGGLEWAFLDRWSAKIEYLYVDFGSDSRTSITNTARNVTGTSNDLTDNIVRVGVNYRFGGPVISKY
jgi:outer membrane immunogenic protein